MAKIHIEKGYGSAPNSLLNNPKISLKAKGLYTLIQAKPDNWDFSAIRIQKETKDGKDSILSALKELEDFGYLDREYFRNNKGHFEVEYILYFEPKSSTENPLPSSTENPTSENPHHIQKNNNKKIINISSNEEILCDDEKNSSFTDFSKTSNTEVLENEEVLKNSAETSTKPKLGQALEAEKLVRKTSSVSTKTAELNTAKAELQNSLLRAVGCDAFKDYAVWTELGKFLKLIEKIGKDEFIFRLEKILEDPFKAKNSNKLSYLRKEIECFIHSPIVPKSSKYSVGQA